MAKRKICKDFDTNKTFAKSLSSSGFSQTQISKIMGLSKKCVWFYINSTDSFSNRPRPLTLDEKEKYVDKVGKPRGRVSYDLKKQKVVKRVIQKPVKIKRKYVKKNQK